MRRLRLRRPQIRTLVGLLLLIAALTIAAKFLTARNRNRHRPKQLDTLNTPYLISTSSCNILDLDPFDKSVAEYFQEEIKPVVCLERDVTAIETDRRMLLQKNTDTNTPDCCYRAIRRVTQDPHNYDANADYVTELSDDCHPLQPGVPLLINDSFIKVECRRPRSWSPFSWLWRTTESDYFAFVQPPDNLPAHVQQKVARWDEERERERTEYKPPPSILILGLDSTSRLQMTRALPRTRALLLESDFIELLGYTRVGVNTLPNVMALLTGQHMFENSAFSCMPARGVKFDDCPFLWKNFSDHGYLTTFIEDFENVGTFDYLNIGFVEQPTDYYTRPLMTSAWHLGTGRSHANDPGGGQCLHGGFNNAAFILRYLQDILALSKARGYPTFSFAWLVGPTHDNMNVLKNEDDSLHDFFDSILTDTMNYDVENTVIFFIGDHGYHMGPFRETFHGFYEDNLPMMFVRLPSSLKRRFPEWDRNLRTNARRLISTFDFRETLIDLLQLSAPMGTPGKRKPVYRSLVESEVPETRTCADAGIKGQDCMCGVRGALELEDSDSAGESERMTKFSQVVLDHINNVILRDVIASGVCARLSWRLNLYGRTYAEGRSPGQGQSRGYLVGFEAAPSRATFEAYVREYENGTVVVEGDIYRLNMYRGQSDCVEDKLLERYCYCTNLLGILNWFGLR